MTTPVGKLQRDPGLRLPVRLSEFEHAVPNALPAEESRHPIILDLLSGEFRHFAALCEQERISARTRNSLQQVGGALCGYPQLASEARFAAGQVGHVARRLLLGERIRPFVGHVDLEEIIA